MRQLILADGKYELVGILAVKALVDALLCMFYSCADGKGFG